MNLCNNCETPASDGNDACEWCGSLFAASEGGDVMCENHPGERAIACCTVCAKPVCGDCASRVEGRFVCETPGHRQSAGEWAVLVSTMNQFESDMITINLRQSGFRTLVADPSNFAGTLGLSLRLPVRVLVERKALGSAGDLLRSLQITDSEISTGGTRGRSV